MLDFKMKVIIKLSVSYNYCCWSINYLIKKTHSTEWVLLLI